SAVFASIYKFLPDKQIAWRDVIVGAVATAILFTIGKSLIGIYIGRMNVAESYGTAGSLIVMLLWIYYSTVTFLLGAEFTRAYAVRFGSHAAHPAAETERIARQRPQSSPVPEPRPAHAPSREALAAYRSDGQKGHATAPGRIGRTQTALSSGLRQCS